MSTRDAKTLYQELVLDHGKSPRNEGPLEGATHDATAKNPLCGDRVTVHAKVTGRHVEVTSFEARGCMIAKASASLLTEAVRDLDVGAARALVAAVEALVVAVPDEAGELGPLEALRGVSAFPARRACVTLAWRALDDALRPIDG
ncbi:MAG: system NifU family Fe-S cluster assembly protein [Labilithrix sp.]|nr:system NifU family Fe-S cluster assembly protein [Labilithrix sp.]